VVTYGVHLTAYVKNESGIKIWVPRRSKTKQTFPGMLDNTVAGGIASGEDKFESLVREAMEEASLPEELVRREVKEGGQVTYLYVSGEKRGGEMGLMFPECQFVYDLELPVEVVPQVNDCEVEVCSLPVPDRLKG